MKPHYLKIMYYVADYKDPKKARKDVLVWFKRKWRKVTKYVPIASQKKSTGEIEYKAAFITFEGCTLPRRINEGVCSFIAYNDEATERALKQEQFWFQHNGPQITEYGDWYISKYYDLDPVDFRSPPKVIPND